MNHSFAHDAIRSVSRRHVLAATLGLALPAWAQDKPADYEPRRGQFGKDVVWVATPDAMVDRMLMLAGLTPQDTLIDLGAGDGKIVIAAARAGSEALGIEYNPDLVAHARRRAEAAGVAERARFERADIFDYDFSRASVITLYLLPRLNVRLRHRLMALKPGTRVVSHSFEMGDWVPDETTHAAGSVAYLWVVPANFGGEWRLRFPLASGGEASALLTVKQRFQRIEGLAQFDDFNATLRQPLLAGDRVRFALTDAEGRLREFDGRIDRRALTGSVTLGEARVPFSAARTATPVPPIAGSEPLAVPKSE